MKGTIVKGGYAMVIEKEEDGLGLKYGRMNWLVSEEAGGREYNFSPKGDIKEVYADGKVVFANAKNSGYDGTITLIDIIDDVARDWYDQKVGENGERAEYATTKNTPKFAWVQIEEETDGTYRTTIYPYCYVTKRTEKKGKTSEEGNFDYEFPQHNIAIRPRPTDKLVCYEQKSNKVEEFEELPNVPTFEKEVKKN